MKMFSKFRLLVLAIAPVLFLFNVAKADVTTWTFNSVIPEQSMGGQWENFWIQEVEKRSGGRLKFNAFFGGELGYKGPELLEVSRDGLAEVSGVVDVFIGGSLPEITVIGLGFLMPNPVQGEIVRHEVTDAIGKVMREKWNTELVGWWPSLGQTIITKDKISSVDDIKGKKLRTSTAQQAKIVTALGGFPQTILFGEIYTSMQLGVIEGFITGARNVIDIKFYEVADYVALPAVNAAWDGIMVNKDAFDSLPSDLQQILRDAGEATAHKALRDQVVNDLMLTKDLAAVGVQATQIPADELEKVAEQMLPVWDEWSASASPEGQALLETIKGKLHPNL